MKILLIQPPFEDFYATQIRLYPLGLIYVAGVFEQFSHRVEIIDCVPPLKKPRIPVPDEFNYLKAALQQKPYFFKHYFHFGIPEAEIADRIKKFQPDLIGITANFTAYYRSVDQLAKWIRSGFDIPIFIGGNHATVFTKEIRERTPEIDFILPGPAEQSIPVFLSSPAGKKLPARPVLWQNLMPAHHLLNGGNYQIGKKNYISLTASRGCPFTCDFCNVHKMFGRKMVYRDATHVVAEMEWNFREKGVRIFNFEDDNLTLNRKWLTAFLDNVSQSPVLRDIEMTAMNGICYPTLNAEILHKMKTAGFKRINFSFVTKNLYLRRTHNRPGTGKESDNFERIVTAALDLGFMVTVYIIIGLPEQSYKEIEQSVDYLFDLGVLVGPSVFYLPPGSKLFERLAIPPQIKNNWNMYRSSAFAVETEQLNREQLINLFCYVREKNKSSLADKTETEPHAARR
ncbi:MAG TPA: B12-binding domain-containing radical SAM protein [Bacteroidetes bacterium]|nr:B12-binding domain-containing radical SAM protein [Bacteroidota bacterium]